MIDNEYILYIADKDNKLLFSIATDATVRVRQDAEFEAARALWGAIEFEGKTLYARAAALEADLAAEREQNERIRKSRLRLIGHVCEALGHLHMNFRSKAIDTLTEATSDNDISSELAAAAGREP